MKKIIVLIISTLIAISHLSGSEGDIEELQDQGNDLQVYYSPDLKNVVSKWVAEFRMQNPGIEIRIADPDVNTGYSDENGAWLGFITADYKSFYGESMWNTLVGRDIIVPVFNSNNPFTAEIKTHGITPEKLGRIISGSVSEKWGNILENKDIHPVSIYVEDGITLPEGLSSGENAITDSQTEIRYQDGEETLASVKKDRFSVGICRMSSLLEARAMDPQDDLLLFPVDRNSNGIIEYMESFYDNPQNLLRGVWMGKYPGFLVKNIYSIADTRPQTETEIEFLSWILSEGQEYLGQFGFTELLIPERQARAELISAQTVAQADQASRSAGTGIVFIISGILAVTILVLLAFRIPAGKKISASALIPSQSDILDENSLDVLPGLFYDKSHMWAFMEKDGCVRIGIDDFLRHVTGPITRVIMKEPGTMVSKGKTLLSIVQNGKQLNIYSPVSGVITEINTGLNESSSKINESPYSEGWVYRIEPSRWMNELSLMIPGRKYREWIRSEIMRLKEFLSYTLKNDSGLYASVLQDGGELRDTVLMELGPEAWEEFQTKFIDEAR